MGGGQGPYLHEQDFGRTIRDTGERDWGAHREILEKERKKEKTQGRDGRTARRHHTGKGAIFCTQEFLKYKPPSLTAHWHDNTGR